MAHLWVNEGEHGWAVLELEAAEYSLNESRPRRLNGAEALDPAARSVLLMPKRGEHDTTWVLIAGELRSVHVGGRPLKLGIRELVDRDEIRIAGAGTVFFSTETLARVVLFPPERSGVTCPRCTLPLLPDQKAVLCPTCCVWYHQIDGAPEREGERKRECWTHAPHCVVCRRSTALDAGFSWSPDDL